MNIMDLIKLINLGGNKIDRRKFLKSGIIIGAFLLGSFSLLAMGAMAKDIYPAKDITFIVGHNVGGGFDITARLLAVHLTQYLRLVSPGGKGGVIKVKNVPAGSGGKAYIDIYNSDPDGYIIGDFNPGDMYDFQFGTQKLPIDMNKFTWLFTTNNTTRVIISNKKGLATWEEMIALSKKEPIKWGMASTGGSMHVEAIYIKETVGIPGRFLITGGTAPLTGAIIRGEAHMAYVSLDAVKSLVDAKEVNVLLSFTEKRIFPEVPTIVEKGFPQILKGIAGFRGVIAPPNLDPEVKNIIISAAKRMNSDPEYQKACKKAGFDIEPSRYGSEIDEYMKSLTKLYLDISPMLEKYLR